MTGTTNEGPARARPDSRPPAAGILHEAVRQALAAPSVHNTQPWRWRIGDDHVDLHADRDRFLPGTDPEGRDLLISCGAALHHLRVALAGAGVATHVVRLPDPEDRDHLATVRVVSGEPGPMDVALHDQLVRRHSDRRAYADGPVDAGTLDALVGAAAAEGGVLWPVLDPGRRERLLALLGDAATRQQDAPGYLAELMTWTHRYHNAHDGVPIDAVPRVSGTAVALPRRFPAGTLGPEDGCSIGAGTLLALCTRDDDTAARLRAGEATSAVLLTATHAGLASAPLSQAVEVATTRDRLRWEVLGVPEHPQLILRVGERPPGFPPLLPTPRRPLRFVLQS